MRCDAIYFGQPDDAMRCDAIHFFTGLRDAMRCRMIGLREQHDAMRLNSNSVTARCDEMQCSRAICTGLYQMLLDEAMGAPEGSTMRCGAMQFGTGQFAMRCDAIFLSFCSNDAIGCDSSQVG